MGVERKECLSEPVIGARFNHTNAGITILNRCGKLAVLKRRTHALILTCGNSALPDQALGATANTAVERAHPDILNGTRRRRIARGSGNEVRDVNQLVSQFEEMKDMMKTMQKMTSQGRDVDMSSLMDKITGGGGGQSRSPR
jgi:hypothetical protein